MKDMFKKILNIIWYNKYIKPILLFIVILLVILDYYQLSIFPVGPVNSDVLGSVSNWFSGLITAVAVIIATKSLTLSNQEIMRMKEDDSISKFNDLGKVYSWLEYKLDKVTKDKIGISVVFVNKTDIPIYSWSVNILNIDEVEINDSVLGPLMPDKAIFDLDVVSSKILLKFPSLPSVQLTFTNSDGVCVTRDYNGKLSKT